MTNLDKMPKWLLADKKKGELRRIYFQLPFVSDKMSFSEFLKERERQKELNNE